MPIAFDGHRYLRRIPEGPKHFHTPCRIVQGHAVDFDDEIAGLETQSGKLLTLPARINPVAPLSAVNKYGLRSYYVGQTRGIFGQRLADTPCTAGLRRRTP